MKLSILTTFFISSCLILFFASPIQAITNPLVVPNNHFGIHITDDHDLDSAAALVNSQGGNWGYVTVVIRQNDRNLEKWQRTFDKMRELHLIPIIRLATEQAGNGWQNPNKSQAKDWADFLNSLTWVIKNRYIILFNEPNHAQEWGGKIAPNEYVEVCQAFIQALRTASPDFYILPAGFDLMAPNSTTTMEVTRYYQLMHAFDKDIFTRFDGWTSHAYPNPHFAAAPNLSGKTSLRSYRWEISYLKQYGLRELIPLFITETGWNQANLVAPRGQSVASLLEKYWQQAYTQVFTDGNIVAVTPFLLRYLNPPFSSFSWLHPQTDQPLPHYYAVQNLPKVAGMPVQDINSRLHELTLPTELVADSAYTFEISFENIGQSIWTQANYALRLNGGNDWALISVKPIKETKPHEITRLQFSFVTPKNSGTYLINFTLVRDGLEFGESITRQIKIIPPPGILVNLQLWYKRVSSGNDFSLLIYEDGKLFQKISPITVSQGKALIEDIKSVVPGNQYRFVLTKPYYLPRQTFAVINSGQTSVSFQRLLPFDFYPDGQFNLRDVWNALRHPLTTLKLLSI